MKLIAWISVDKADQNNGCLKVIPGSHRNGFRNWYSVAGATHHDRIKLTEDEAKTILNVETNPGDVVLFSNYLVHSSAQNDSGRNRRALRFVYKGVDDIDLPRGALIMMRSNIDDMYVNADEIANKKSYLRRLYNKLTK